MRHRSHISLYLFLTLLLSGSGLAIGEQNQVKAPAPSRIRQSIDAGNLITLQGHVLKGLTPDRDMGAVEDSKSTQLYMSLKRTPAQQADLDGLLARQQQPGSPDYHKWLTPQQFGARFGASQEDIHKISLWLESQGFQVTGAPHNASVINFTATAAGINHTFHAQLHYWNVAGGKYMATKTEPSIPAALANLVSGIAGLNQIPPHTHHTPIQQARYDAETHKFYPVNTAKGGEVAGEKTHYLASNGDLNMTPQDFYTIYNLNPTLKAGNVGGTATIGILGSGPFNYGTVTAGKAAGGDVTTFRNLFGITTPLNLLIQNGDANFPCTVASGSNSGESALDVEWAGATAPGATLIFESCSSNSDGTGYNFLNEIQALVDANVVDIISSSIGFSEPNTTLSNVQVFETAFAQAAAQGQTVLSGQGDSGSDDVDFGAPQGTHGLSIDYPGSSTLVLSVGGTDFQDTYDSQNGGLPQSTYWGATNTQFYGNALSYVPEMVWNENCSSPFISMSPAFFGSPGETGATNCNIGSNNGFGGGTGGGVSIFFAQPSWQAGFPGLSASVTTRATPDVSLFSSGGGYWHHAIVVCDSGGGQTCTSPDTFGYAGGTSFAAPQFAGIIGLLKTSTGSRQGLVQPALYALAKAEYSSGTACYANGQTANTGVTTGLPASSCIFNDVTTSDNNNECLAGTPNCFTNPGATQGVFTSSADTSIFVDAYAAGPHYDLATGLGSVNVTNLLTKWNTAFTSSTALSANPTSITTAQSTTLTATVTVGQPAGSTGQTPTLAGKVSFATGATALGSCTLSGTSCSISVAGSALPIGPDPIVASFVGSGSYPSSTSNTVTVTVSSTQQSQTITFGALPNRTYGAAAFTLTATASSGLPVTYTVTGPATVTGSTLKITGAGTVKVTASQAGNASYTAATPVSQSFTVAKASLTATANNASKTAGTANPTFTYTVAGFVNGDTSSVVGGSATLTSTATTSSPAGSYPITFATSALTATNYTFTYVAGTLAVTGANQCSFINYSNGFTPGGIQLNGGATIANGILQLTDGKTSEARSAFFKTPVPLAGFVTDFTFQLLNPVADGFAIVLQANNPSIVGGGGGGLGYAGIKNSSAVKFDLYNNSGEGVDSTGFYYNGANPSTPSINLAPSGIDLHNGHIFAVHFTFNGSVAAWTVTDTVTKAVFSTSLTPKANPFSGNVYVGFTAGTGGNAATQNILTWTYNSGPGCPVN